MKILNQLPFDSLLNVGGADGFQNYLIEKLFRTSTFVLDMTYDFIRSSHDFFKIPSACGDGRALPFKNNSFDIVMCVETIEHVENPQKMIDELMRVSRSYVLIATESYFEDELQKSEFLNYIRETHPRFYRRTNRVPPSDVNHFTKKDFEELFNSSELRFFPQFDRKRKEIVAPIHIVRDLVEQMSSTTKIDRASRIIVLYSKNLDEKPQGVPRVSKETILNTVVSEIPSFDVVMDDVMTREDEQTRIELENWWEETTQLGIVEPEHVTPLEIDEADSSGVTIKWLTADNVDASPLFCLREVSIEQNGFTPQHSHAWEHQLFILEGHGSISKGEKTEKTPLKPGIVVRVPPNISHQIRCNDSAPLKYLDIVPSITHFFGR